MAFRKKKEPSRLKKYLGYNSKIQEVEKVTNGRQEGSSKHTRKRIEIKTIHLYPVICGHPDAVDLYLNMHPKIDIQVDNVRIRVTSSRGNDSFGKMSFSEAEVFLCVYDVRKPETVRFLRERVLPSVKKLRKPMAIAGLGLECRCGVEKGLVDIQTACQLGKSFDCKSTEFMCCDGKLLTFCTFALYSAVLPHLLQWKTEKPTTSSDISLTPTVNYFAIMAPKTRKVKSEKKENKPGPSTSSTPPDAQRRQVDILVAVVGAPEVVDRVIEKFSECRISTLTHETNIIAIEANGYYGRSNTANADLILAVYDVCDNSTVEYLTQNVLPHFRQEHEILAICGTGLENRTETRAENETDINTCNRLARLWNCRGTEVVTCSGPAMAAGLFALYATMNRDVFQKPDKEKKVDDAPGNEIGKRKKRSQHKAKEKGFERTKEKVC
ncbi:unnamed protein product [Rodentolepis nana]|uniref:DJ-1_PfpI domain-containing protein n=1 Tax=Rodentolepis nana TaxID=102285 RepID=A0A0R3TTA1_RODNA|nr:unnamed protein product [Rodentolepis nana]